MGIIEIINVPLLLGAFGILLFLFGLADMPIGSIRNVRSPLNAQCTQS